jgi:hypothetical protein
MADKSGAERFSPGATAYAPNGTAYTVEDVADGIVYCSLPSGAEAEFPAAALATAAEFAARSDKRRNAIYERLKQARAYTQSPDTRLRARLDPAACEQVLAKSELLCAGILDFAAFTVAARCVVEAGDGDLVPGLSVARCRAVFDGAGPAIRAGLLAALLGTPPDVLVGAGRLGDNLIRAMLDKGMAPHRTAFESFGDRRRR